MSQGKQWWSDDEPLFMGGAGGSNESFIDPLSYVRWQPRFQARSYNLKEPPIIPAVEPETHGLDIDARKPPLRDR